MQFALIAAGRVNGSFIARLPRLRARLGPVLAQSYRLASRIVNTLGAGQAARSHSALAGSRVILICVAPAATPAVAAQLAAWPIEWKGRLVLLCDCGRESPALSALAARGAITGSLNPIPGLDGSWFVAEGDRRAVAEARRLAQELKASVIAVPPHALGLYQAGLTFASGLFTPLVEACVTCLRGSGLPPRTAALLADALFQQALRAYRHAGRKSWSGPLARGELRALKRELDALRRIQPPMAEYYHHAAEFAWRWFQRDSGSALNPAEPETE